MQLALQLYSLRNEAARDLPATLQAVRAMGYDGVELADEHGRTPAQMSALLQETHLHAVGAHIALGDMAADPAATVQLLQTLHCPTVAVPFLGVDERPGQPGFARVLQQLQQVAPYFYDAGIALLYHNHNFELAPYGEGRALDAIYAALPPHLLQGEPDTCWLRVAGVDPVAYLQGMAGRVPIVHLKDFTRQGDAPDYVLPAGAGFQFRPVGHGLQDMPAIVAAARAAGAATVVVEQDESPDRPALQACADSCSYLRTLGV